MPKILVADDSPLMRNMVSASLETAGYEVLLAEDGQVAYDLARGQATDVVITDVNMPRLDGLALISRLRSLPAYKHTPILVLTTEISEEKRQIARKAGASGWLVKPFQPQQLLSVLKRFVA